MMGRLFKLGSTLLPAAALILAALGLLLFPQVTVQAAARGLSVCAQAILPSLFPFFAVTNLWISLGYAGRLSRAAAGIMEPVFHLPGEAASALVLGCIGGYPVGAQVTARLYEQDLVDRETAAQMLFFCSNAGPAFIFGVVGAGIFQSVTIGAFLYGIHLVSALLLGFLFRPRQRPPHRAVSADQAISVPFFTAFTSSIRQAGETALQVCIFVLFFSILTGFLSYFSPTSIRGTAWFSVLLGSLELAGGAGLLAGSACPAVWKLCAAAFLLGWGGLCVHSQTLALLSGTGLPAKRYLLGKLLHGLLSGALALMAAPILPLPVACAVQPVPAWGYPLVQMILLLLFALWAGRFLKITTGKHACNRL